MGTSGEERQLMEPLFNSEQLPRLRDTFEVAEATVLELETGARNEVLDGSRDENLARAGHPGNPRSDVHGDSCYLLSAHLALTRMDPGSNCETEFMRVGHDSLRAEDRPSGTIKGCEEPIACGVDLGAAEARELTTYGSPVPSEEFGPIAVAE